MKFGNLLFFAFLLVLPLVFFYKTIFFGMVPFPGDLLVGNYEPYKSQYVGIPHKGQGADVVRELYPWKYFSIESIKRGEFPLWNPYVFSGTPHFASLQSGTLYPVNIIFFVLPFVDAWTIYIILQYVFALLFTYLYLRVIGLQKLSVLFGSIAFSFCSFLTVWGEYGNIGHSLVYLPLVLFSIEKILRGSKWYWFLLLIFSFVFSIFAGYLQLTIYIYILSALYVLCKFFSDKKKNIKLYILIIASFAVSILLSFVQLLPLYELVSVSLRGNYSYKDLLERLLPPESLVTLLVPDFFGNPATNNYFMKGGSILERTLHIGLWTFIFAIFSLLTRRTFYTMFFSVTAVVLLVTCVSFPVTAYLHEVGIPFLSTGIPTRVLSVVSFCFCVLGAVGFDAFFYRKEKKLKLMIVVFSVAFVLGAVWLLTFVVPSPLLSISQRNLIIPTGIFILGTFFIVLRIRRSIVACVIVGLLVIELFYSFQKFNSFVPKSFIYPDSSITNKLQQIQVIDRVWGYGNAHIDSEFQIIEKIYGTEGYNPLFSKTYGEFLSASDKGTVLDALPKTVADIKSGYGVNELKESYYRRRTLDLTGTKYLLNKKNDKGVDSAFDEADYKLIWQQDGWQIYESLHYIPRLNLVGNYEVIPEKEEIINRLFNPEFNAQNSVILEQQLDNIKISSASASSIKLISYTPQGMKIETQADADQLLFISDTYFPGWKAYVDGVETPIYRANYTYRAIPILKGEHLIEVKYEPQSFKTGLMVTVASLGCLILAVLFGTLVKVYDQKNKKK